MVCIVNHSNLKWELLLLKDIDLSAYHMYHRACDKKKITDQINLWMRKIIVRMNEKHNEFWTANEKNGGINN